MKAYQVHSGDTHHGYQVWDLKGTFFDEGKAEELALEIVAGIPLYDDALEDTGWVDGGRHFYACGWDRIGICKIVEIMITE